MAGLTAVHVRRRGATGFSWEKGMRLRRYKQQFSFRTIMIERVKNDAENLCHRH